MNIQVMTEDEKTQLSRDALKRLQAISHGNISNSNAEVQLRATINILEITGIIPRW